jgi:hypothetical protein
MKSTYTEIQLKRKYYCGLFTSLVYNAKFDEDYVIKLMN